jgi:hypothetical protein
MLSGEKIKQILYPVIEELGKENIQLKISSNIKVSQEYIDIIMNRCISKIDSLSGNYDRDFDISVLSEALLHYMLTISTLPSERKVEINDDQKLDIVIPSLPSLRKDPNKSLIIQVIKKKKTDLTKIKKLESTEYLVYIYSTIVDRKIYSILHSPRLQLTQVFIHHHRY